MRSVVVVLLVAAGCGRFNFDELVPGGGNGDGDGGTGGDGSGVDDGDILIDAPAACFLAELQLTTDAGLRSLDVSVAGSPTGFAVVWNQELAGGGYELKMERFANGVSRGRTTLYTSAVPLGGTTMIWANNNWVVVGTQHYVSGNDDDLAVLLVADVDGLPTASHRVGRTNDVDRSPAIAWSGNEYGLVWMDGNSLTLYYRQLGPTLTDLTGDIIVDTGSAGSALVGWNAAANVFMAAFMSGNSIPGPVGLQAIAPAGSLIGSQSTFATSSTAVTALAVVGSSYMLGYSDSTSAVVGYRGNVIADVPVASGGGPAPGVTWTGSELGTVYWRSNEIRMRRVDSARTPIDPVVPVAGAVVGGVFPRIAFSADHYAVAWVDPAEEIHYSELCPL